MLPPGSKLEVVLPDGTSRKFTGVIYEGTVYWFFTATSPRTYISERRWTDSVLRQLQIEEPLSGELVCENGYNLTFGIDGQLAFVQYSGADGDPPYLVAAALNPIAESHNFVVTNELTAIDGSNCLSFVEFESIARHFMETGKNSPSHKWNDAWMSSHHSGLTWRHIHSVYRSLWSHSNKNFVWQNGTVRGVEEFRSVLHYTL